jgi:tetratricopeptide (TPR) repeat protein
MKINSNKKNSDLRYLTPLVLIFLFINTVNYGQSDGKSEDLNIEVQVSSNDKVVELNRKSIKLAQNGDLKKAEMLILKALEIEPNNYVLIANYGNITSNLTESIKLMNKSYKLSDSTYHTAGSNLSRLYAFNKEYNKGVDIATFIIQNSNNDLVSYTAYFHRIQNNLGLNKCEEAIKDFDTIKRKFNKIENSERHIKIVLSLINDKCRRK